MEQTATRLNIRSIEFINLSSCNSYENESDFKYDFNTSKFVTSERTYNAASNSYDVISEQLKDGNGFTFEKAFENSEVMLKLDFLEYDVVIAFTDGSTLIYTAETGSWSYNKKQESPDTAVKTVDILGRALTRLGFNMLKKNKICYAWKQHGRIPKELVYFTVPSA